jgi:PPOX class probable F420-dependent enzyme
MSIQESIQQTIPSPRPGARPVAGRGIPSKLPSAKLAPPEARTISDVPRTGSVADVRKHKQALLVTYRRDGTPVPTPVWAAEAGGRLYVRTERISGKLKRLRNDPRMLVAPCTVRGKPLGAPFEATGRLVPPERARTAERALSGRFGAARAMFEWSMDRMRIDMCYLEITPCRWDDV